MIQQPTVCSVLQNFIYYPNTTLGNYITQTNSLLDCFLLTLKAQINLSPFEQIQYEELMAREMENKRILIIHLNKPAKIKAEDLFNIILDELENRCFFSEREIFRRAILGFDHDIKIPSYTQIAFDNAVHCRMVQIALSNILRKQNMCEENSEGYLLFRSVKAVLQSTYFTIRCTLKYLKSIMNEFNKVSDKQKMILYMNTPIFFFRRKQKKSATELSCYSSLIRSEILKCTVRNDKKYQILWLFKNHIPSAFWLTFEMALELVSQYNKDPDCVPTI